MLHEKPHKFRIKIYTLADLMSGYVARWKIYTGKEQRNKYSLDSTIHELLQRFENQGFCLFCDNYFHQKLQHLKCQSLPKKKEVSRKPFKIVKYKQLVKSKIDVEGMTCYKIYKRQNKDCDDVIMYFACTTRRKKK